MVTDNIQVESKGIKTPLLNTQEQKELNETLQYLKTHTNEQIAQEVITDTIKSDFECCNCHTEWLSGLTDKVMCPNCKTIFIRNEWGGYNEQ